MGRRPVEDEGEKGIVIAIWQGSGVVEKKDTIYRDHPDFSYDDR